MVILEWQMVRSVRMRLARWRLLLKNQIIRRHRNTLRQAIIYGTAGCSCFMWGHYWKRAKIHCHDIVMPFVEYDLASPEQTISAFATVRAESIDYALMERTDKAYVIASDFVWNDVGSWASLQDELDKDAHGNAVYGEHIIIDTKNSMVIGG